MGRQNPFVKHQILVLLMIQRLLSGLSGVLMIAVAMGQGMSAIRQGLAAMRRVSGRTGAGVAAALTAVVTALAVLPWFALAAAAKTITAKAITEMGRSLFSVTGPSEILVAGTGFEPVTFGL